MKKFALIGCGGFIAPRHLQAIKNTGNELVVACDVNDSVGVMDSYFPSAEFFTKFEDFFEFLQTHSVDYLSICSPNYLHKTHAAFGLRNKLNVICEKPLVLNESDLDELIELEKQTHGKINTVLQVRIHPSIIALKEKIDKSNKECFDVELIYLTSRGPWFHKSWKGDQEKSGGLAANIGIHFFDMLVMLFGNLEYLEVHHRDNHLVSGFLQLSRARVKWVLSVDKKDLPPEVVSKNMTTYRSITVDGEEVEFSGGFNDLHTKIYEKTLSGNGFGLEDARVGVRISERIRDEKILGLNSKSHEMLKRILS